MSGSFKVGDRVRFGPEVCEVVGINGKQLTLRTLIGTLVTILDRHIKRVEE